MAIAISNVVIKKDLFMGTASVKCAIKSPNQLVIGPGKTGKKLPIIPSSIKRVAIIIKIISI